MNTNDVPADRGRDRRASARLPVTVPVTLRQGDQEYTAKMLNVVANGAMLESSTPVDVGSTLVLRCGTIIVDAMVVWRDAGQIGLKFETSLTDDEVREQVLRTAALAERRESKGNS